MNYPTQHNESKGGHEFAHTIPSDKYELAHTYSPDKNINYNVHPNPPADRHLIPHTYD